MDIPHLDWSTATVDDGRLTIELDGERPKGWKRSFKTTVRLLGSGDWGEVELKKDKVQVSDVPPGVEEKLRHYLESVVEQANASCAPDEDPEPPTKEEPEPEEPQGPDAEMTDTFRSFADTGSHDGGEDEGKGPKG